MNNIKYKRLLFKKNNNNWIPDWNLQFLYIVIGCKVLNPPSRSFYILRHKYVQYDYATGISE